LYLWLPHADIPSAAFYHPPPHARYLPAIPTFWFILPLVYTACLLWRATFIPSLGNLVATSYSMPWEDKWVTPASLLPPRCLPGTFRAAPPALCLHHCPTATFPHLLLPLPHLPPLTTPPHTPHAHHYHRRALPHYYWLLTHTILRCTYASCIQTNEHAFVPRTRTHTARHATRNLPGGLCAAGVRNIRSPP